MEGSKLTGSTGFAFSLGDKMANQSGKRDVTSLCDGGFSKPNLI